MLMFSSGPTQIEAYVILGEIQVRQPFKVQHYRVISLYGLFFRDIKHAWNLAGFTGDKYKSFDIFFSSVFSPTRHPRVAVVEEGEVVAYQ